MELLTKKCVNAKNYALTVGKEYNVVEQGNYYVLTNDNNKNQRYYKTLFEDVVEEVEIPQSTFSFNNTLLKIDDESLDLSDNIHTSYVSCGISEFTNLNGLFYFVNKSNFNLTDEVRKNILKEALDVIWNFNECPILLLSTNNNDDENEEINEYYLQQKSIINEVFLGNITEIENQFNPNSDNEITLWVINS